MKKTIFTLSVLIVFSSTILYAQNPQSKQNEKQTQEKKINLEGQFLDADYQRGKIIFKDGINAEENLNYHLNSNRISYINEKSEPFVLVDLSDIIMVSYGDRTFIPMGQSNIAELLKIFSDESRLLLQRHAKISVEKDNKGPFGVSTTTASVNRLTTGYDMRLFEPLEMDNIYKPVITKKYILMKDGKRYTISRLKSLKRVFRSKWAEIEEYAAENSPDLKNHQDLIDLLEFCTK